LIEKTHAQPVRDKSNGGAHTQGYYSILCLCTREAESSLFEHSFLKGELENKSNILIRIARLKRTFNIILNSFKSISRLYFVIQRSASSY
jgi:hypothetical protein